VCYQPAERGAKARGGDGADAIEFEERAYSSGWGLACRSWKPARMRGPALLPGARVDREAGALSSSRVKLVVVERLSEAVHAYLKRGGRVLLLAQPGETGLGSKWINLWGQVPWISEEARGARGETGAIRPGEGDAVLAMLHSPALQGARSLPVAQRGSASQPPEKGQVRFLFVLCPARLRADLFKCARGGVVRPQPGGKAKTQRATPGGCSPPRWLARPRRLAAPPATFVRPKRAKAR
jgi:hypothetical protein